MVIEYGSFRYYEGGDNEANDLLDAVNPTAQVVGPVDVATLNRHGQGVTKTFAELLDPKAVVSENTKVGFLKSLSLHRRIMHNTTITPVSLLSLYHP